MPYPGPYTEPMHYYNQVQSGRGGINFGYEHAVYQDLLDRAGLASDVEERWELQAEIARWLFDNVIVIPTFIQNLVFPVGPKIEIWELMGGWPNNLSNWEYVTHRE